MKRICKTCGITLDNYVFVFEPTTPQQINEDLKIKLPGIEFTVNGITGNKIKLEIKQELNPGQITILENYFTSKNYERDIKKEEEEIYG